MQFWVHFINLVNGLVLLFLCQPHLVLHSSIFVEYMYGMYKTHGTYTVYIYIFCEAINEVPSVCAPLKSLAKTGTLQQGIVFRYHHGDTHPVLLSPSVLLHFAFSSNPPHLSPRHPSHLLATGYRPRSCCHFPASQCGVAAIGVQPFLPVPCSCSRKPDNYLSPVFRPADCLQPDSIFFICFPIWTAFYGCFTLLL